MKFVAALLLNYVAAIKISESPDKNIYNSGPRYDAASQDSAYHNWKYAGQSHLANDADYVADAPKGYTIADSRHAFA